MGPEGKFISPSFDAGRLRSFTVLLDDGHGNPFYVVSVEISGTITEYRNKPEIVLESPDQVKVVE